MRLDISISIRSCGCFSNASGRLGAAVGMSRAFMQRQRRGFATFEQILQMSGVLRVDMPYLQETGIGHLGNSSPRMIHRMTDPRTGAEVARVEPVWRLPRSRRAPPCPLARRCPWLGRRAGRIGELSSGFRNLAGRWDTVGVSGHRGDTGCPAIRLISSRRRCGGPQRAAEAACRLRSPGGTWPPRRSAVLRIFSAMMFGAFAHRTVSTACVTSFLQQRSASLRTSARPAVNALPLSRAVKPRFDKGIFFDLPPTDRCRRNPCRTGKTIRRGWLPDRVKCGKPS